MNTLECLINRKMIEETRWNRERHVLKNSWTKWLTALSIKWTRSRIGKTRWSLAMKKRKSNTKEIWSKNDLIESRMTRKKCEISWISKCKKRDRGKQMKKQISTYKLKCGIKIRKIMMKRKEGWRIESKLSIRIMLHTSCNKSLPKTLTSKEWTTLNSLWIGHYWEKLTTSLKSFLSMMEANRAGKIELK